MNRLLDSFRLDDNRTYTIMYFFVFLLILVVIALFFVLYLMFRDGQSFSKIISLFNSLPTILTNYKLYFFGATIFIIIIGIVISSQTTNNCANSSAPTNNNAIVSKPSIFWKPDTALNPLDPTNLRITSSDWQAKNCEGLTLGAEIIIFNTRALIESKPYRHILHRGSSDIYNYPGYSPGSAPVGSGGINDGLPSEMSPGILIDRITNDLLIFVDTDPDVNSPFSYSYRESVRINDLPLNKAFYLHLVINKKVLEVYINCRLAGTKVLHGKPRNVGNEWFGRTGFATAQAVVQNVNLWDGPINTFDLMNLCKKPIVIKKEIVDLASSGSLPSFNCGITR